VPERVLRHHPPDVASAYPTRLPDEYTLHIHAAGRRGRAGNVGNCTGCGNGSHYARTPVHGTGQSSRCTGAWLCMGDTHTSCNRHHLPQAATPMGSAFTHHQPVRRPTCHALPEATVHERITCAGAGSTCTNGTAFRNASATCRYHRLRRPLRLLSRPSPASPAQCTPPPCTSVRGNVSLQTSSSSTSGHVATDADDTGLDPTISDRAHLRCTHPGLHEAPSAPPDDGETGAVHRPSDT